MSSLNFYNTLSRQKEAFEPLDPSHIRIYACGPTVYDRILAVNMFGTKTVLLIAVFGLVSGRFDYIDIALVYALINFISIVAVLRFFEYSEQQEQES